MAKKTTAQAPAGPTQRMLRVAEMIRHKLAEMLSRGDIHDDTLASHVITIPEVRITPDLKTATVYVMPLGGEGAKEVIAAFNSNKRYIRGEIARAVNLKFAPDLKFRFDEMFDEAARIEALLDSPKVRADTKK
jgi:ribosome-binding factor A